jgi:predicted small secreted protein
MNHENGHDYPGPELCGVTLSACETMKGFGKDMEDAGEWVQKKAQ